MFIEVFEGIYSKVNFLDVFEYMSEEHSDVFFVLLVDWLCGGGRIVYWNLFVECFRFVYMVDFIYWYMDLVYVLLKKDCVWFYGVFYIEEMML